MTLVTNHWFALVESWIGLRPVPYTSYSDGKGFIREVHTSHPDSNALQQQVLEFEYHPEAMPECLPQDYKDQIFETGKSLRMLRAYHPHHPLVRRSRRSTSSALSLRLAVEWEDIERIQSKASEYERELRCEMLNYYRKANLFATWSTEGSDNNELETTEEPSTIKDTFKLCDINEASITNDGLPTQQSILSSKLHALIEDSGTLNLDVPLEGCLTSGPPLSSSVYYSLTPVISAQTRMINYSCLQLLFQGLHIRSHLSVQWRFQLLCDGVFSSRLSLILFDPDMHSGERKRNVATAGVNTGLRLGSRDTWPPATSEIRLVLMRLLSDCYHGSGKRDNLNGGNQGGDEELPGGLSFAIRQLNKNDMEKFRDPDSVEAVDFLRLIYTPPPVLENVITPKALDSYDFIFRHLLRVTRLLTVVRNLGRHSTTRRTSCNEWTTRLHLFRVEALHFIEALAEYIFQFGIGRSWQRFNDILEKIERGLAKGDVDQTLAYSRSLSHLRAHHEAVLDWMQSALLLSKPHAHARKVLEDIFRTILLFAPVSKTLAHATEGDDLDFSALVKRISQLHANFRRRTHEFVQYLREICGTAIGELAEQPNDLGSWAAEHKTIDDAGVLTHLLLRLDFNQYY
ncbi:hypothetical protein KEM54_000906 [Ascosphaera aggregata]|nr:hypothetical protein KEM54_000906 [Ascosphaera aggregata]